MVRAVSTTLGTPLRRMVAVLVVINLFVLALVWVALDSSYRQYQDRAAITSHNVDRLVAQSVSGDIERIDLVLRSIVDEVARRQAAGGDESLPGMQGFLDRLVVRLPMADSLRIANAQGAAIAGSGGLPPGVTIDDRGYFIRLRDDPTAGLAISPPVLGRVSGKWVLIFARRFDLAGRDGEGRFGGVVYAPVTIDWFVRKFAELEVGSHGVVVMRGDASRDFDILARFPRADMVGQTKVSKTFRDLVAANPGGGTYVARAGGDDVERVFSYTTIPPYPLITLVGLATQDHIAEWWRDAIKVLLLAGSFSLVSIVGGMGILRAWRAVEARTDELARSNADLEQFAYVASHDLQTPLRNIVSYTQLLERRYRGRLDSDADDFIGFIVSSSKQMAQLISDLLEYSRVSNQSSPLQPVSAAQAAAQAIGNLKPDIDRIGAEVVLGDLPVVMAEPNLLASLFQNLIGNALKYRSPNRPLRVSVSAQRLDADRWRLAVADNGIGIDPAYHEKVFEIFQRLSPNSGAGGTGIGLTICRRIVHRFGGRIELHSSPGDGATFSVVLRDGSQLS